MTNVEMWPGLTFLFSAVNLAAWYFHGAPLFSWWWIALVIIVQVLMAAMVFAIAKMAVDR